MLNYHTIILLFNLLLAILGDSFGGVQESKDEEGLRERLNICLEFLDEYSTAAQAELETETLWVHQLTSPAARYADGDLDDDSKDEDGVADDVERVNDTLRTSVKEMADARRQRVRAQKERARDDRRQRRRGDRGGGSGGRGGGGGRPSSGDIIAM